jgi:mannose-6-phosphate isomerase-like protein (cupin superfamily)
MARVEVVFHDAVEWTGPAPAGSPVAPDDRGFVPIDDPDVAGGMQELHRGSVSTPSLHRGRTPANMSVAAHAHDVDEIVVVEAGTLILGSSTLRPGDSVYIPALTPYAFRAGADGLTFLNFRCRRDTSHLSLTQLRDHPASRR